MGTEKYEGDYQVALEVDDYAANKGTIEDWKEKK